MLGSLLLRPRLLFGTNDGPHRTAETPRKQKPGENGTRESSVDGLAGLDETMRAVVADAAE